VSTSKEKGRERRMGREEGKGTGVERSGMGWGKGTSQCLFYKWDTATFCLSV